jgi:signal transduction histidine kinase/Skp family chaperone for outer membrane proteins
MNEPARRSPVPRPRPLISLGLFVVFTALMAWLRLAVYADQVIALTYGLPLLVCIWYRDRLLLWSLAAAFTVIATIKAFLILSEPDLFGWSLHVLNIAVIAGIVDLAARSLAQLARKHAVLAAAHRDLRAHEESIRAQNEELQSQTEELSQQNEEIQQQSEELQQQTEELQTQADELQQLNRELEKRQAMLETLLGALRGTDPRQGMPEQICRSLLELFDGASAAAIFVREGDRLACAAHSGFGDQAPAPLEYSGTLAAVVIAQDRTGFIADLADRPDLRIPAPPAPRPPFRSLLSTPLRGPDGATGVVEVYADQPRAWTKQQFHIAEWAAAQCSLALHLRRLHSELVRANTGLDHLVRERTAELQEMVNELEHFSYTITHDLRAPLRALHGFSEMLAEELQPVQTEQTRLCLERIAAAATRMDRLITDALSFSKVLRHQMELTPQDPGALLAGMIDSYPAFQPPLARVRVEGPLPRVLANEAGLTQCFSNLLGNAVKFVPRGRVPEVMIRAERREGRVRLWFEDNGIGIAPEMGARIFGMFQRLSKDYEGTGIGLALVKKVTERMQGRVGFESTPGVGSRFWLEFHPDER